MSDLWEFQIISVNNENNDSWESVAYGNNAKDLLLNLTQQINNGYLDILTEHWARVVHNGNEVSLDKKE